MNRVVALISLLIAVLSAYGQQQIQWYDVSNFAPSVKQCMISLTDDRLFVYVYTDNKDVNFWVGEPQRYRCVGCLERKRHYGVPPGSIQ